MILNRILLPLFVVGLLSAADPKYTISTLAGSRPLGDGGTATAALVASPNGVAVDDAGNLYVADVLYHRVRKITPDGRISTVLGTDSGAEPNPELLASQSPGGSPFGVALDKEGNLFVGTSTRIVKVDTDGKLTLIAGDGSSVADGAKATSARIADLRDLAFDGAGNLHYVDFGLNLVRKISADGLVTTVAGNPNGVEPFSGDGGPAKVATLNGPKGIIFDSLGNLFITDYNNGRIRKVGLNGINPKLRRLMDNKLLQ